MTSTTASIPDRKRRPVLRARRQSVLDRRQEEELRVESLLRRQGVSEQGIAWRRSHIFDIDMWTRELRRWLDTPHHDLSDQQGMIREANAHPVKCPICGKSDNDWPVRHGLCCDCWCREMNLRYSSQRMIHAD